ncbi:MAG TPA: DUF969 domain-containing protein [Bacillota bacterium]|nr:DUF969 domain-containing protein [Bacillota bacterium]
MLTLIGVAIVIVGFAMRFNPMLVVTIAGIVTGLVGHLPMDKILSTFGEAFVKNRYLSLFILTLPVIGILERNGLKEQSQNLIGKVKAATTGRLLILYLFIREVSAALGLTSLGGHAQMVRPLIAPMAEGAAENKFGSIPEKTRNKIRAFAASSDNVGVFFGEDIFIAFGAVLLMKGFFEQNGIQLEPLDIAVWGIPTALAAFIIHGARLILLDRMIKREVEVGKSLHSKQDSEEIA